MSKARRKPFVTLDLQETADTISALDSECERLRRVMARLGSADIALVQAMLERTQALHDRLKTRFDASRADLLRRCDQLLAKDVTA
jgi:hypothetical protein